MPSPFRAGSPLARRSGPKERARIWVSAAGQAAVAQAAAENGITQRMIVDALLERPELVRQIAAELAAYVRGRAAGVD